MNYRKMLLTSSNKNIPNILYSEFDKNRCETRKIHIFSEEKILYSSKREFLADQPISTIEEVEEMNRKNGIRNLTLQQFIITKEEFEEMWNKAKLLGPPQEELNRQ